jgi:hypothetical protein
MLSGRRNVSIILGMTIIVSLMGWLLILKNHAPKQSIVARTQAPAAICPGNALRLGLSSLETVREVPVVAIAHLDGSANNGFRFTIKNVLKGHQLRMNDVITVCPGFSGGMHGESFDSTLLLLRGREEDSGRWVPEELEFGVIPQDSSGMYTLQFISEPNKTYSLPQLKLILFQSK